MKEYSIKQEIGKVIQALGFHKDEAFLEIMDYCFQPFFTKVSHQSEIAEIDFVSAITEIEGRVNEKTAGSDILTSCKYKEMILQVMMHFSVLQFNDNTIDIGLKYHLANGLNEKLNDFIYVRDIPNGSEVFKGDFEFIKTKKEQYQNFKKGEDLNEFWQLLEMETYTITKSPNSGVAISKLEVLLKQHKLISQNDILSFSVSPIDQFKKVNWLGTQLSLIFMLYNIFGVTYKNQRLFSFAADRFLVKSKEVTAKQFYNSFYNLYEKHLKSKKELPIKIARIKEILDQSKS